MKKKHRLTRDITLMALIFFFSEKDLTETFLKKLGRNRNFFKSGY